MSMKSFLWYRKAAFFLLLPFAMISQAEGAFDESARIKLIKALAGSVVGINSTIIKSSDLMSQASYKGTGSGFLVDAAGHVATLRNIISDTHSIEVILRDGTTWPAMLKGEDSDTGIAVLEVQAPAQVIGGLQHVKFAGAGAVIPGRDVLVLGRTEGGEMLMAASGMVSCAARTMLTFRGDPSTSAVSIAGGSTLNLDLPAFAASSSCISMRGAITPRANIIDSSISSSGSTAAHPSTITIFSREHATTMSISELAS